MSDLPNVNDMLFFMDNPTRKSFLFRGIEYRTTGGHLPIGDLTSLYLIHKALDGDELANELLKAAKTVVRDVNGKQVYPPEKGSEMNYNIEYSIGGGFYPFVWKSEPPTKEGWYWAEDEVGNVEVVLFVATNEIYRAGDEYSWPNFSFTRWIGPLPPPVKD